MKKRFKLTSLPFLILTLLLVGCSSDSSSSGEEEIIVDFFNQKIEINDQLESLAEKYSAENPNVQIRFTTVGSGDGAAAMQAKFASGDEPAILMLGGLPEIERYKNTLLDVSDMAAATSTIEGQLDGGTIDGVPYGIPMNNEGFGWMYNKEIFEQAGIDPEEIQSYSDFVTAVDTLESQKEDLGLEAVFAYSGSEDFVTNQFSANFTAPEFDNNILTAYEATELNWEYGDKMKAYTDLIIEHTVQPILTVDYSSSVEDLFINGHVAMVHQGNWIVPTLNGLDSEFAETKLGILPLFVESDTEGKLVVGAPWYLGINKNVDEEIVTEAENFLDWMFTSEIGKQTIVEDLQFIPAHEGFDIDSISDPVSKEIYQALLDGETTAMAHKQYPDGYFQNVLHPEFQRYLNNDITWDEFEQTTSEQFSSMKQE
ncbi:ABC transporter substrate-binding protein [Carnobacterium pleistocenium]|uniref:ABC transporter substrate-binding protein n=1 Tax=Carnobacterium pleistocenium TaxID=181073 RepID=UPI0005598415|nr:ABC transporter substrate-binding protein [Carnobacterium pleistocenium]